MQFDVNTNYGNKKYSGWNMTSALTINQFSNKTKEFIDGNFVMKQVQKIKDFPNGLNLTEKYEDQMRITRSMTALEFKNMNYPSVNLNYGITMLPITEVSI